MNWLIVISIVFLVLVVIAIKLKLTAGKTESFPYTKKQVLFSQAERSFFGVLNQAIGEEYLVFGKVRIADVVEPQRNLDNSVRQKALNRISSKHLDYVLCAKEDLSVACVIELNDQSHQQRKRQERDAFLVGLCQAVSLPLVQVTAQRTYLVSEVRAKVMDALGGNRQEPSLEPAHVETPAIPVSQLAGEPLNVAEREATQEVSVPVAEAPSCPKCSAPMVCRQAKSGSNAGQKFWGCSTFPKCRGVIQETA
jgi:hypothetical protein